MPVMQTTLLTGPYDWDADVVPQSVFAERLARVRAAMDAEGASALVVHGHAGDYGALHYLTSFVPKLGPALALVPRAGALRILVPGTEYMVPYAQRLTWVEDVRILSNIAALLGPWLGEHGLDNKIALATWGGAAMPRILNQGISRAIAAPGRIVPLDAPLDALRRRKSPLERVLMRRATVILEVAADALLAAARGGAGHRSAALAAERAAYEAGAQDARVATSLRPGGAPLPLDGAADPALDPLLAAIAVQFAGYWAEGYVTATARPGDAVRRAEAALDAVLADARAGASAAMLMRAAVNKLAPDAPHALMQGAIGHAIGLSLDEAPLKDPSDRLEDGAVYVLRVGAADAAVASAMIAVDDAGIELMWRSPRAHSA